MKEGKSRVRAELEKLRKELDEGVEFRKNLLSFHQEIGYNRAIGDIADMLRRYAEANYAEATRDPDFDPQGGLNLWIEGIHDAADLVGQSTPESLRTTDFRL